MVAESKNDDIDSSHKLHVHMHFVVLTVVRVVITHCAFNPYLQDKRQDESGDRNEKYDCDTFHFRNFLFYAHRCQYNGQD